MSELDGDDQLRLLHKELGPRWRYNDPRFDEDLPDYLWETWRMIK